MQLHCSPSLIRVSSTPNNPLTSARFLDKNTNLLWALGILLPHTGACHSRDFHESGFLVLLQEKRNGHTSDCWKTSRLPASTLFESLELSLRLKRTLKEHVQRGELEALSGRHRETEARVRPGKAFTELPGPSVDCPHCRCGGSLRTSCSGKTEAGFTGPLARFLFPVRGNVKDCF